MQFHTIAHSSQEKVLFFCLLIKQKLIIIPGYIYIWTLCRSFLLRFNLRKNFGGGGVFRHFNFSKSCKKCKFVCLILFKNKNGIAFFFSWASIPTPIPTENPSGIPSHAPSMENTPYLCNLNPVIIGKVFQKFVNWELMHNVALEDKKPFYKKKTVFHDVFPIWKITQISNHSSNSQPPITISIVPPRSPPPLQQGCNIHFCFWSIWQI